MQINIIEKINFSNFTNFSKLNLKNIRYNLITAFL